MQKIKKLEEAYNHIFKEFEKMHGETAFSEEFYQAMTTGTTDVGQKRITDRKVFNQDWIKNIEQYLPSIDKITRNPKSGLRYENEVVQIEKAKKINSQSIRHLASHSHFIKEIREDGSIMPSKILTTFAEIDYATYENRFVKTLINRLAVFIRHRYNIMVENVKSEERTQLQLDSNFKFSSTDVTMKIDLTLKNQLDDEYNSIENMKLLERVAHLRRVITRIQNSDFMENLKGATEVRSPIIKNQVILKNVDYNNAYKLWIFLDRYNVVLYEIDEEEKDLKVSKNYYHDLQRAFLTTFVAVAGNLDYHRDDYSKIDPRLRTKDVNFDLEMPSDDFGEPEKLEHEDIRIQEYFLQKNREIFDKTLSEHEQSSSTYEIAIKRALRDTISISNALYESFFGITEEDEIIEELKRDLDVQTKYDNARNRARVARYIREVKEVDYRRALKQEKRMIKEMEITNNELAAHNLQTANTKAAVLREEERIERAIKISKRRQQLTDEKILFTKEQDEQVKAYRDEVNTLIRATTADVKVFEEESIEYEHEYSRDKYKIDNQHLVDDFKQDLSKIHAENKGIRDLMYQNYIAYQTNMKAMADENVAYEKELLTKSREQQLVLRKFTLDSATTGHRLKSSIEVVEVDYEVLTTPELKEIARVRRIEGYSYLSKPTLIRKIKQSTSQSPRISLNFADYNIDRLTILAREMGLHGYSGLDKQGLIDLIEAHDYAQVSTNIDYSIFRVEQLKEFADNRGLTGYRYLSKPKLIELIEENDFGIKTIPINFDDYTIQELVKLAQKNKIKGYSNLSRSDLIIHLRNNQHKLILL